MVGIKPASARVGIFMPTLLRAGLKKSLDRLACGRLAGHQMADTLPPNRRALPLSTSSTSKRSIGPRCLSKVLWDYPEWSSDSQFIYFLQIAGNDRGVIRVRVRDGTAERVVDLKNVHLTGALFGFWFGLDPTDAPLLLRDISGDDIYALTLETK
jgi:hypothetical protein